MKKSWLRFFVIVLLTVFPVMLVCVLGFAIPDQFEKTFLGEFDNKVERLYETEGEKIIILGGSSVAFGVDAELLSETLGKPVINFGLYATLGTKTMLDFSRDAIGEGDIIVIAPEHNAQTWSLYFNAESMWQAVDGDFSLLRYIDSEDIPAMLGGFWRFASSKVRYAMKDEPLDPDGIYNAASFDEYGFIRYRRDKDYNIMESIPAEEDRFRFDSSMISADFVDYVNEYIAFAEEKGAKVYLSFCPVNENAIASDLTLETLETFTNDLRERFDCEVLGDPNNMIYPYGYFYDTDFHLNSAGAVLHTRQLALDIAPLLGMSEADIAIEVPEAPEIPKPETPENLGYDENEVYFTYEVTDFGVYITGVTDLGKEQSVLRTPRAYDGQNVTSLRADAFAGCDALRELYITENIGQISDGTFRGAKNLAKIHILKTVPGSEVDSLSKAATDGLPPHARFYVPAASYDAYITSYSWGPYASYILPEDAS